MRRQIEHVKMLTCSPHVFSGRVFRLAFKMSKNRQPKINKMRKHSVNDKLSWLSAAACFQQGTASTKDWSLCQQGVSSLLRRQKCNKKTFKEQSSMLQTLNKKYSSVYETRLAKALIWMLSLDDLYRRGLCQQGASSPLQTANRQTRKKWTTETGYKTQGTWG